MGTINPVGHNLEETWENIKAGVCGIDKISQIDVSGYKVQMAGEVKDYVPENFLDKKEVRKMDRYTQFGMIAAREALKDSGLDMEKEDAFRCGTIVSSGIGGLKTIEENYARGVERGFEKISPFFIPMSISNMCAGEIAIMSGFKGVCESIVTACASGNNAIGESFHKIRDGYQDVMMAGGAEGCICDLGVGGFTVMKALSTSTDKNRASIPFDAERGGFVMGEGAGILILEELEHAKARGAKIYAEMVGEGESADAYHITASHPEGLGAKLVMQRALDDAGLKPEDIDYINVHGTSTHVGDISEAKAIKEVFGDAAYKLNISSTKSMTGHMLGAAGAVEAMACVMAVHDDIVPPTINHEEGDNDPELDYNMNFTFNKAQKRTVRAALSNTFGFGGHNACVIFKKYAE